MAATRVLLASFESPTINNLVPFSYAQDYKKLVRLTHDLYGDEIAKDSVEVHFHMAYLDIDTTGCNARIIPDLWDKGEYFTSDFTTGGELYVYAHFLSKKRSEELYNLDQAVVDFDFFGMDSGLGNTLPDEYKTPMDQYFDGTTTGVLGTSSPGIFPLDFGGPTPEEVTGIEPLSTISTPLSSSPPTPLLAPPSTTSKSKPSFNIDDYPELPADATPENFIKEREAAKLDNTRDSFLTTDRDIRSLSIARRCQIARSRLIAGNYGVDAKKPCGHCQKHGRTCRVLHPMLLTSAWEGVPGFKWMSRVTCAWCMNQKPTRCNAAYGVADGDASV